MRDKHVFPLYISSSSLKKRLTHAYRLTLMSFFIEIMMGNYETYPVITPISFFLRDNYGTPFLTIRRRIAWNQFHISKVYYLFVFTSQTNKFLLNWVVLILIEQNIILKTRNQDFQPSKMKYVITLLKWLVRLVLFFFLVICRSTFKVVLTIFGILFHKKPF